MLIFILQDMHPKTVVICAEGGFGMDNFREVKATEQPDVDDPITYMDWEGKQTIDNRVAILRF